MCGSLRRKAGNKDFQKKRRISVYQRRCSQLTFSPSSISSSRVSLLCYACLIPCFLFQIGKPLINLRVRLMPDLSPSYTGAGANYEVDKRLHVQFLETLPQHKQLSFIKLLKNVCSVAPFFKRLTFTARP